MHPLAKRAICGREARVPETNIALSERLIVTGEKFEFTKPLREQSQIKAQVVLLVRPVAFRFHRRVVPFRRELINEMIR